MSKIILPKELNPKWKIGSLSAYNLILCLAIITTGWSMKEYLGNSFLSNFSFGLCIVIGIFCVFDDRKLGKKGELIVNSSKYLYNHFSKNKLLYSGYENIKIISENKKGKKITKKKKQKLNDDEIFQKIIITNKIESEIKFNSNTNMHYIKRNGKYVTFFNLQTNLVPMNEKDWDSRNQSISAFNNILMMDSNFSIRILSSIFDLRNYEKNIDQKSLQKKFINNKGYQKLFRLKKWQLHKAENIIIKKYILKIEKDSLEDLNIAFRGIKNQYNFSASDVVTEEEFLALIDYMIADNTESTVNPDYIYNNITKKYQTFLLLDSFKEQQQSYYLQNLTSFSHDFNMRFSEIKSPILKLDNAKNALVGNYKFERSATKKLQTENNLHQIERIMEQYNSGNDKLLKLELIVKIEADSLEELNLEKKFFLEDSDIKNNFIFYEGYFKQDKLAKNFYEFGNNIFLSNYVMSSSLLAEGYPFNFASYLDPGGILHYANYTGALAIDLHKIDPDNNQKSFNILALGETGSGKSTVMKELCLEEICMKDAKAVWFDYDNETVKMVRECRGNMIIVNKTNINLLEVLIDPSLDYKSNLSNHITDVISFFKLIYKEMNRQEESSLQKALISYYKKTSKENKIPTLGEFSYYVKNTLQKKDFIFEVVDDFIETHKSYAGESDENFSFDNALTSISFSLVKGKPTETAHLFWILKFCSYKVKLNRTDEDMSQESDKKFKNYTLEFARQNKINTDEIMKILKELDDFEDVFQKVLKKSQNLGQINGSYNYSDEENNLSPEQIAQEKELHKYLDKKMQMRENIMNILNKNVTFLRICIDEVHRPLDIPESSKFIQQLYRESRKYFSGIFIADQKLSTFLKDEDRITMFGNSNYKIFLKMAEPDYKLLISGEYMTEGQVDVIRNDKSRGAGCLLLSKNQLYNWQSPINEEINNLFNGGR